MPRRCIIPNCTSNSKHYNRRTKDKDIYVSTFLFPNNEQKLKLWLELINTACNSSIKTVTKCSGICMKHFEAQYVTTDTSVKRPDGSVLTVPLKRPRLTMDAVPTIFLEEKEYVNATATKRKFVNEPIIRRPSTIVKEPKKEPSPSVASNLPPTPLSTPKRPPRPKPLSNVSGTYIIKAEIIRSGPKLILDECVSRIEKDKQQETKDTQKTQESSSKDETEEEDDDDDEDDDLEIISD